MVFYFQQHFSPNYLIQFRGLLKADEAPRLTYGKKLFRSWTDFEYAATAAGLNVGFIQMFARSQHQTEGRSPETNVSEDQLAKMGYDQLQPFDRIFTVSYAIPMEGFVDLRASESNAPPLTIGEKRNVRLPKSEFLHRLNVLRKTANDFLWEGKGVQAPAGSKLTESDLEYLFLN